MELDGGYECACFSDGHELADDGVTCEGIWLLLLLQFFHRASCVHVVFMTVTMCLCMYIDIYVYMHPCTHGEKSVSLAMVKIL